MCSAEQPQLATLDPGVGVGQLGLALPERLDLAAPEHDAALVGLEDVVVVAGPAVGRDLAIVGASRVSGLRPAGDGGLGPRHPQRV